MRETNTTLTTKTIDLLRDSDTVGRDGLTSTPDFVQRETNNSVRFIYDYLLQYKLQGDPIVIETEVDKQFYNYPPGLNWINSVTQEVGGVKYTLETIESESTWNRLNMIDYSGSTYPQYIHPRKNDFGIYPIPQTAGQEIVFNAYYIPKNMTAQDYSEGTISVSNDSDEVSGTGTDFTSDMVGRWIDISDEWYRISEVTDATNLVISRPLFGSSVSDISYTIGESPDIPEVLHELIPYKNAGMWYAGARRDFQNAQPNLNYFWTGDFNNSSRDEANVEGGLIGYKKRAKARGREVSQLVQRNKSYKFLFNEAWTTSLSE